MSKLIVLIPLLLLGVSCFAQEDHVEYTFNGAKISADYDTAQYCSRITVTKDGKTDVLDSCTDRVYAIKDYDFEGNGQKTLLMTFYTGGAHCCFYMVAGKLNGTSFAVQDTLWWGDSDCEIKDIDKDGKLELSGVDVRFAYAFTSFAGSRFPIIIYQFRKGKFVEVTKNFPDLIEKDIKGFKDELKDYVKKGFECPKEGDDIYVGEAGEVKAILAAIVEGYFNLGSVDDGYDYVKKIYTCPDRDKFIKSLKTDYKLK